MKRKPSSPNHLLHQEVAQLLSAYLDGQVDDRERHLIEQHLSTCPVCQGDLESLRRVVHLLNRLPAVTPPHPFTLRPEWAVPARPPVWRWLFGVPGLATGLATLMCVVLLAGALLYNRLAPHRPVIPLARMPVTYSIPTVSTVESVPGVTGPATQVAPSPAVAHDEIGVLVETPPHVPTPASPIASQPVAPLVASPIPSPGVPEKGYEAPSPTLPIIQLQQESAAETQPSSQRTEVPSEATGEEEVQVQRYESVTSPEPSFTAPAAVGTVAAPAAIATPPAQPSSEEVAMPYKPSPAIVAAAPPMTEILPAPTPSVEEAGLPPEPSPAAETPVMSPAMPVEAPKMPSPTQALVVPAKLSPTAEAMAAPSAEAPVISTEPSPAAEMEAVPPETEILTVPTETPTASSTVEAPEVSAESPSVAEIEAVPSETVVPAMPTETPIAPPPAETLEVSAELSPAAEIEAVPTETEMPTMPTEMPTVSSTEEALPATAEKAAPVTLTAVEPEATEAPGAGPTEAVPTPTPVLIPVRDLRLTIKPGLIRVEGALPLPPGQPIRAELWREGELMKWAIPETQRGKLQGEGRFELELKAPPDHPDFDLFRLPPARYEVRITPLEFEAAVEARIPFDTFPPATKQP